MQTIGGLRSFECVASVLATFRAGTPVKAAKRLAQAPSTVYRAIERLENEIGAALFERKPTGWRPTEIGSRVVRLAETIETQTAEAELSIFGSSERFPRPVRLSASDGFAEAYLAPVLTKFAGSIDRGTIELVVDNQFANLSRREAHIAIRPSERPGDGLVGRRAGKLGHALYCAAPVLKKHDMPKSAADLARFKICMLSAELERHTAATWWTSRLKQQVDVSFVTNTEMSLAAAIAAGAGVGILPCFLGDRLAGVRRIPTIAVGPPVDIWIVTHPALRQNPTIRGLIGTLSAAIRRDAAELAGVGA
jgi:DNA-binding transcriptional LysR family regulator